MSDRIEKSADLRAPVERVWRALTDHEEFGTWFRVKLDGPFIVGEPSTGRTTLAVDVAALIGAVCIEVDASLL